MFLIRTIFLIVNQKVRGKIKETDITKLNWNKQKKKRKKNVFYSFFIICCVFTLLFHFSWFNADFRSLSCDCVSFLFAFFRKPDIYLKVYLFNLIAIGGFSWFTLARITSAFINCYIYADVYTNRKCPKFSIECVHIMQLYNDYIRNIIKCIYTPPCVLFICISTYIMFTEALYGIRA